MKLKIYTDWWSRGNPWSAWLWVAIYNESMEKIEWRYKSLWVMTNNEAEYLWAFYGVKRAIEMNASEVELYMDSNLVIKQLSWEWKIKKEELRIINQDIKKMIDEAWLKISFNWVPREQNKEADRLSNIAMDNN
jgi:ribonuclease HI